MDTAATAIDDPPCNYSTSDGLDSLMHVDKLHDYLRANAMKMLIPLEHK